MAMRMQSLSARVCCRSVLFRAGLWEIPAQGKRKRRKIGNATMRALGMLDSSQGDADTGHLAILLSATGVGSLSDRWHRPVFHRIRAQHPDCGRKGEDTGALREQRCAGRDGAWRRRKTLKPRGEAKTAGGESGIRTHVRVSPKHAFQACAFSHSAISPRAADAPRRTVQGGARYLKSTTRAALERPATMTHPHVLRRPNAGS